MFEWLPVVGDVIDGVLNLIGVNSTNQSNQQINTEQMNVAQQMQQNDFSFQQSMFDQSNNYNSPAAQRQRYEQAGLNPYLMMGQGNATATPMSGSGGSVPSQIPMQAPQFDLDKLAADFYNGLLAREEIKGKQLDNQLKQYDAEYRVDYIRQQLYNMRQTGKLTKRQRQALDFQIAYLDATQAARITQTENESLISGENLKSIQNFNDMNDLRVQLAKSQIRLSNKQINSLDQQIRESGERILKSRAERKLLGKDFDIAVQNEVEKILHNGILATDLKYYDERQQLEFRKLISEEIRNRTVLVGPTSIPFMYNGLDAGNSTYKQRFLPFGND